MCIRDRKYVTTSNLYWDGFVLDNLKEMPFKENEIERCMAAVSYTHLMRHLNIICHLPLYMLIQDYSLLNEEESKYAANINTHIDFLIYNRVKMCIRDRYGICR